MKNIIKGLFIAVALIFSLSSCEDDAETPNRGAVAHPQEEVQGTYTGKWSRQEFGKEDITYADGTAVFAPAGENYVTKIDIKCADMKIDMSAVANIAPGGVGYMFHNPIATNGFGAIFSGTIDKSMNVQLSYKKTVKEGRKSYTYTYTFNGVRQN